MPLRLALPDSARQLPLADPEYAIAQLTAIIAESREHLGGSSTGYELKATEAVEQALAAGAVLMAVLSPESRAPAVLTGVMVPASSRSANSLRDALEDVGGPDVRETITLDTPVGPVVVAQRVPGVEQARAGRPLTLQLQAFIPDPNAEAMLLLTLASPTADGWPDYQSVFGQIVCSAHTD